MKGLKTGGRKIGSVDLRPRRNARATIVPTPVPTPVAAAVATAAGGAPPDGAPAIPMRAPAREATAPSGLKIRYESLDNLREYERNANEHPPAQIALIERLLAKFGWTTSMGKAGGVLIYGHARRQAAINLRDRGVVIPGNPDPNKGPVVDLSHLSKIDRRLYVIADNESARKSVTNADLLALEVQELGELGADLALTGLDDGQLSALRDTEENKGNTDPDDVPPLAAPVSVLGDVWILGRHRLHCADCRDVLPTLTGIDAVVTSPPYNLRAGAGFHMGHKGSMRPGAALADGYATHGDDMPWPEYETWQREVLTLLWATLSDNGAIFYNHKPRPQDGELWLPLTLNPNLPLRQIIVWDRRGGINFSASHFLPMQEWVLLFAKPGFRLVNKQASVEGDVWSFGPEGKPVHPAAFPADLPLRALRAIEAPTVLDPFSGSGTTIIAAEMTGRACHAIELSPQYCDVSIRRWQAFTGAEATHSLTGRTFAETEASRTAKPARTKVRVKADPQPAQAAA
jgi:site-specific DNA-methyltransferase (adenine-specific)